MKKFVLLAFCVLSFGAFSQAQNLKFGHLNTSELISLMSERDSAFVKLQAYQNELEETLDGMMTEYNNKVNEFQRKSNENNDKIHPVLFAQGCGSVRTAPRMPI